MIDKENLEERLNEERSMGFEVGVRLERGRINAILNEEPHDTKRVVTSGVFQEVHEEKYCRLCVRLRKINDEEFE